MTNTVTAMFETRKAMESALYRLELMSVTHAQIGVVMSDETRAQSFVIDTHSKENTGMATGATIGGIATGLLAAIVGVGTLTIPGLNLVVVGSVVSGLVGGGIGAAVGGLIGGLVGMGIPEHEAKKYEGELKAGHIMLVIEARDSKQAKEVKEILDDTQAFEIAA